MDLEKQLDDVLAELHDLKQRHAALVKAALALVRKSHCNAQELITKLTNVLKALDACDEET